MPNIDDLNKQLLEAVENNDLNTTQRLLNDGANPSKSNVHGCTPLRTAAENRYVLTVYRRNAHYVIPSLLKM